MAINRRKFLKSSALGTLSFAIPSLTLSQIDLGSAIISTISDGAITLPGSLSFDSSMPSDELDVILNDFELSKDELTRECNLTLYDDGSKKVLFDAGAGVDFLCVFALLRSGLMLLLKLRRAAWCCAAVNPAPCPPALLKDFTAP